MTQQQRPVLRFLHWGASLLSLWGPWAEDVEGVDAGELRGVRGVLVRLDDLKGGAGGRRRTDREILDV